MNLEELLNRDGVRVRGVIECGAHVGEEFGLWKKLGARSVIMIEPQPHVFHALDQAAKAYHEAGFSVKTIRAAVANKCGKGTLRIMNADQSSSLLDLKDHAIIYPDIKEIDRIEVDTITLDSLIDDGMGMMPDFNFLKLDIQGAELHALYGAERLLNQIDAIQVEVNFRELYAGCPLMEYIDEYLRSKRFHLVHIETPHHESWGDALYVKNVIASKSIGTRGRLGNQIFQYFFLKCIQAQTGLRIQTAPWEGQSIFGLYDPPLSRDYPTLNYDGAEPPTDPIVIKGEGLDLSGYFQFHTRHYAQYRDLFRETFKMVNPPTRAVHDNKRLAVVHIRRGDYLEIESIARDGRADHDFVLNPPREWYELVIAKLREAGYEVVVCSDDPALSTSHMPDHVDWWLMTQADFLVIANSTFSFTAAMANQKPGATFARPTWAAELVEFDPWNSEVLLRRNGPPAPSVERFHSAPPMDVNRAGVSTGNRIIVPPTLDGVAILPDKR